MTLFSTLLLDLTLLRAARIATDLCNGVIEQDKADALFSAVSVKAVELLTASDVAWMSVKTGGDPRGYCLKVKFHGGQYNTWGGAEEGWGF